MTAPARRAAAGRKARPFAGLVDVDGQMVNVAVRPGRCGGGVPLLVCNGIGANLELLDPLVDALDDVDVIRFDVPGIGASPAPRLPYRLCALARLVRRLIETLGYAEADVMGISWGGLLAQQFAWSEARHCRRLVLAATVPGATMVPGSLGALIGLLSPERYGDPDVVRKEASRLYGGAFRDSPELITTYWQRVQGRPDSGYYLQMLAALGWSSLYFLPFLRQETLVLSGEDDPLAPAINGRILATLIPRARFRALPCGHLFVLTEAARVAELVQEFVLAGAAPPPERAPRAA